MKLFHTHIFAAVVGATLLASLCAQAQNNLRIVKDDVGAVLMASKSLRFPLHQVGDCARQGKPYQVANFKIVALGASLDIAGSNASGRAWKAELPVTGLGCEIYTADLDRNGTDDLIVYAPGIGDRGKYGTNLAILLFGKDGTPSPWYAQGNFTLRAQGIQEIEQDESGQAEIVVTSQVGMPTWEGVSYVSLLYGIGGSGVIPVERKFLGVDFPNVASVNPNHEKLRRLIAGTSAPSGPPDSRESSPVEGTDPHFVSFGPNTPASPLSSDIAAPASAKAAGNIRVDANLAYDSQSRVLLSDGTKLDVPTILVLDRADGSRRITFDPDDSDFKDQSVTKYRLHPTGSFCSDIDQCQPFILWAKQDSTD